MKEYALHALSEDAVDLTFTFSRTYYPDGTPTETHIWLRYADRPSLDLTLPRGMRDYALRDLRARFTHYG